ncbi:hypothetical protein MOQ72_29300 [Saccharopolyspora sp. K220]|uniref:hypothetical protein n=1 Tax=Saccharopolyspora soli TaxID=2926618 RepID=UPI001F585966|nr:hypothetical protein [Saccharopolyspora soli]MCI2421539.1 hypothetical protein [Saccharopolyspora soli]
MTTTARREPKRVRSARRRAAHHAERTRKATTAAERYQAAEYALRSAAAHARSRARVARQLREDVVGHARRVLDRVEPSDNSTALYEQKLTAAGPDLQRLSTALMCLRGAIAQLPNTERDRLFEHYTEHFTAEVHRINGEGGAR